MTRRRAGAGPSSPPPPPYTPPDIGTGTPTHPDVTKRKPSRDRPAERKKLQVTYAKGKVPFKYGRHRLPGQILYSFDRPAADEFWYVLGFCKGEVQGLLKLIKDKDETLQLIDPYSRWRIYFYTGTSAQVADTNLGAVDPTWTHSSTAEHLKGVCYAVVKLMRVSQNHPQLPNFLFEIETKKCIVPSTQVETYSELPAVQFYDWLRHPEGKNLRKSRINTASFITAETTCAELVSGVARYTAHPSIEDQDTSDVEKLFALMCDGMFFYSQNQWHLVLDRPASSVATYTDAHYAMEQEPEGWREDPQNRVNQVVIEHTDRANGWKVVPARLSTAAVDQGREHPRPATYRCEWLHDPSVVQRKLVLLLNSYIYDFKLKVKHLASTSDRQVGEVITQSVPTRGIAAQLFRLVAREKLPDNTFNDLLLEYNADRYSNSVASTPAKIASTLPDLAAPPNVSSGTVTWTEQLYQLQSGEWRSRAVLGMTIPTFAFLDCIEVWVSINGGTSYKWFETSSASSLTPVLWETGTYTLTLKTRHKITGELSSGTSVAVAVNGVTGAVAEVAGLSVDLTEPSTATIAAPQNRSATLYGSSFWSNGSGLGSYDGAKVNDGLVSATAFTTPAGSSNLRHDAGASGKRFRQVDVYHTNGLAGVNGGLSVHHSPDGSTWTLCLNAGWIRRDMGGGVYCDSQIFVDPGANKQHWRVTFNAANTIKEVHFAEFTGAYTKAREVRLFDVSSGSRVLILSIPIGALPSSANPLNVEAYTERTSFDWDTSGGSSVALEAVVVDTAGNQSTGVNCSKAQFFAASGGAAPYVPQIQTGLTLANGLNSDISIAVGPGAQLITGPTAAFTMGGFQILGEAPWLAVSYLGSQTCTIANAHASSAAANRIKTFTGADIVMRGAFEALFRYDTTDALWHLVAYNNGSISRLLEVYGDSASTAADVRILAANGGSSALRFGNASGTNHWTLYETTTAGGGIGAWRLYDHISGADRLALDTAGNLNLGVSVSVAGGAKITRILSGSKTWDPASVAGDNYTFTTVTVTGAAVGDKCIASFTSQTDGSVDLPAQILAANTATVSLDNLDPSNAINLSSGTLSVMAVGHT